MTSTQFWGGITTLVVTFLGTLLYNKHHFSALNKRLDDLNTSLNKRIDDLAASLRAELAAGINGVRAELNTGLSGLRAEMIARFAAIDKRFDDLKDLLRSEIKRLEERLNRERITR